MLKDTEHIQSSECVALVLSPHVINFFCSPLPENCHVETSRWEATIFCFCWLLHLYTVSCNSVQVFSLEHREDLPDWLSRGKTLPANAGQCQTTGKRNRTHDFPHHPWSLEKKKQIWVFLNNWSCFLNLYLHYFYCHKNFLFPFDCLLRSRSFVFRTKM